VVTQIALVPLYLSSWDAQTFGAWLLLQAVWGIITVVDVAHHDYVGYECLRLGPAQRPAIAKIIFSAAPVVVLIALWNLLLAWQLGRADFLVGWIGNDEQLLSQWRSALLLIAATWLLVGSLGGLLVRWFTPFGYHPQFAWWGVAYAVLTAAAPALAVVGGANLLQAMVTSCLTSLAYYAVFFVGMLRIARKEGFVPVRPNLHQGLAQGFRSLWLVGKSLAEMARQQGSRIILSPLAGVADMAAFATMRTGANFALQGLNTITSPVMPELMRFLAARDQPRTESTFAIVWLVLCAVLCPAIIVVQWLAPSLFPMWTHGKIVFDPWLFGMLSLGVAVLALAQPASAVLVGNNILRAQLAISIGAAAVAVVSMFWLVPLMGVRGAAVALLAAELTSLTAVVGVAQHWLRQQGMRWPWKAFGAAAATVPVTGLGMVSLELLPHGWSLIGLATFLVLQAAVAFVYWRHLPAMARMRAAGLVARFLPAFLRPQIK
jgi:O-antigen/teichoic acid export membrane protein